MIESQGFPVRKQFLSLTTQDERAIRELHTELSDEAPGFVEGFYHHLLSFPEMAALIPDAAALERLKVLQTRYFRRLTEGVYDAAYGEDRQRVGLAHARIGLTPGWYLGAYSHYLTEILLRLAARPRLRPADHIAAVRALVKVVFLDIGLTLDSYISHRDELIAELREQGQLSRDLLNVQEVANIGIWQAQFDGRPTLTPQAARILGWPVDKPFAFADLLNCLHPDDRAHADAQWREALVTGHCAFAARVQEGEAIRWVESRGRIEHGADGRPLRGYGTIMDITERKRAKLNMERLAFFDVLTGLPNRVHGMDLARHLLDTAGRQGRRAAVLFADLDRFKDINDTRGHAVGDQVLTAVAQHCLRVLGGDGVLARLSGDEFMFVRPLADGDDSMALAREACAALASPIVAGDLSLAVGASIGVALYPAHGQDVEKLLQCADIAMYRAKMRGGGHCLLYDAEMGRQLQRRVALGARLEEAIARSRLELYFQPKVALASGVLCGVEALARWHDEDLGWVSPAEFIPIAEERGLIITLGEWGLDAASRQWRAWRDAGVAQPPVIAVNVSAAQMLNDAFAQRALAIVSAHGVSPQAIELEITESAMMHDPERAQRVASQLVEHGFSLSIDDFGTGYSSLARLRRFPVSRLKIDMSFVRGMLTEPDDLAIVNAVIGLAHALQLLTVAEGVETQGQIDTLRALQCDEAQGYFFARAVPAAELERDWLAR